MEKVKHRRGILTAEQIYSDLKRAKAFIDSSKEPVRIWHLVTSTQRGTVGFMSGPMLRILKDNKVLTSSVKFGYKWNSKIPVTYKLAEGVKAHWEAYRMTMNIPKAPCRAHDSEPEVVKAAVVKKRTVKKSEGWLKRFINWIW